MLARRTGGKKEPLPMAGLGPSLLGIMEQLQSDLLETARARREAGQHPRRDQGPVPRVHGGRAAASSTAVSAATRQCEAEIKEQTKATIRVLPDEEFRSPVAPTTCMWCDAPSVAEAVWAKAY